MCIKSSTREGRGCAFARDMLGLFKVDSIIMFTIIIQFFIFKKETGMYPVSSL